MADVIKHSESYYEAWDRNVHWTMIVFSPTVWGIARTIFHEPGTNADCCFITQTELFFPGDEPTPPIYARY